MIRRLLQAVAFSPGQRVVWQEKEYNLVSKTSRYYAILEKDGEFRCACNNTRSGLLQHIKPAEEISGTVEEYVSLMEMYTRMRRFCDRWTVRSVG